MGKFIIIFLSILQTTVISAIVALASLFYGISWVTYLQTFIVAFAVQLFVGGLWNVQISKMDRRQRKKLQLQQDLVNAAQHIELTCAYCQTTNSVKVLIGNQNTFDCEACKQTNSVLLHCTSARTTRPIMPKKEAAEIFKSLDD